MNRSLFLVIFSFLVAATSSAQLTTDSTVVHPIDSSIQKDSANRKDSIPVVQRTDSVVKQTIDSVSIIPLQNIDSQPDPWFGARANPPGIPSAAIRQFTGNEALFYLVVFLLLMYALLRQAFPKYFNDLFRLFFRTTIKQRQIREQLMQTPLPSLLLNGFFVISTGLYITFVLEHFDLNPVDNFWLLFLYCCIGLSVAYFIKFAGLKISGWLFNRQEAASAYIFIVFVVNKMIGILLLPFLIVLAFSQGNVYSVGLTLSWCLIAGLLVYRFILTYVAIRNQVKVNPFHFFLYLCAFEIAPVLLIYKGLLFFFRQTT